MYTGKKYMCTLPVTLLFGIYTNDEKLKKKKMEIPNLEMINTTMAVLQK